MEFEDESSGGTCYTVWPGACGTWHLCVRGLQGPRKGI